MKFFATFIICCMLISMTACGKNADNGNDGNIENNMQGTVDNNKDSMGGMLEEGKDDMKDAADSVKEGIDEFADDMTGKNDSNKNNTNK